MYKCVEGYINKCIHLRKRRWSEAVESNEKSLASQRFSVFDTLQNGLDHFVAHLCGLGKHVFEEFLRMFELCLVKIEISVADNVGPLSGRHGKLEIVLAKSGVVDRNRNAFLKQARGAKEVLGHTEEDPEEGCGADYMVVGHNVQLGPAVDDGEQRQVGILLGLAGRVFPKRVLLEDVVV